MRLTLLVVFCTLSITASAQFWKKKKPVVTRDALLTEVTYNFSVPVTGGRFDMPAVLPLNLKRSVYEIEIAEDAVLKQAKHNMRYRVYNVACYNFTDLAELYMLQNRFSEAKWYLLQSNELARPQNNYKLIVSNLLDLAAIKLAIGEPGLAISDLKEAHYIAKTNGLTMDSDAIEKRIADLQSNKNPSPKATLRYAEAVELAAKGQ
ncbi:MAG: hypothetical protein ACXVAY_06385 [Mucilaginibacter sp.]